MFGRDWEPAQATIVMRRLIEQGHGGEGGHLSYEVYEYIADVRPEGAALPFRATVKEPLNGVHFRSPEVGMVVGVKFRPKNQEVKFDRDDPQLHRDVSHHNEDKRAVAAANSPEALSRFEAAANAAPGSAPPAPTGPTPASSPSSLAGASAELASAAAELTAAAAELTSTTSSFVDTMAAIKKARAAGDLAEVERLKAEYARGQAGAGPPP